MDTPPVVKVGLLIALALFLAYMTAECWSWLAGNRNQLTPGQLRRRLCGALLLSLDLVAWHQADRLLVGRPAREKLLYLLAATLLALLPMLLAVREMGFVLRQYAAERRRLIREAGAPRRRDDC